MTILDTERLGAISGGDQALETTLHQLFMETAQGCQARMAQAVTTQDDAGWRSACHELKGAAANIGATPLSDICKQQESQLPNTDALAQLTEQIERVDEAFQQRFGAA